MPKAMVIDDSRAIRMILSKTLGNLGYEVCPAANGKEAYDQLQKMHPSISLMLVDWNMPEMNGFELLTRVRADKKYAGVKIIMVTTETEVDQMVAALEAGANEYVMKPFTDEIITGKLKLLGLLQ